MEDWTRRRSSLKEKNGQRKWRFQSPQRAGIARKWRFQSPLKRLEVQAPNEKGKEKD